MLVRKILDRYKWFALALLFFIVNSYAVLLYARSCHRRGPLRAALVEPGDGRVNEQECLRWRFGASMVSEERVGKWTPAGPVDLHPHLDGLFCWTRPNQLIFRPRTQWPPCKAFTATLSDALLSTDLRGIEGERVFSFRTPSLEVVRVAQVDYGKYPRLRIEFNDRISRTALASHLRATAPDGKNVRFNVHRSSPHEAAEITLYAPQIEAVDLTIAAGLTGQSGPIGLEADCARHVPLSRKLELEHVSGLDGSLNGMGVVLSFNRPVEMGNISRFVRIEPEVPVSAEPYYSRGNRVRLFGAFAFGRSYTIQLDAGLRSRDGVLLGRGVSRTVYFGDADPELDLTAEGHYLSPMGNMLLPLRMINVKEYAVTIRRIYPNNLVPLTARQTGGYRHYYGNGHQGLAQVVAEKTVTVSAPNNQPVDAQLALKPLIGDRRGAFHVELVGDDGTTAEHYVVVSDSGVSVRRSPRGFLFWANSLRTLSPLAGAEVKVFSFENQVLAEGRTDEDGLLQLAVDGETPDTEPFLATIQKGDDLTYLVLDACRVEQKKGRVGDRPYLVEGYEAFMFTDRGIYRPGETFHAMAAVRDGKLNCPEPFPVQLVVFRPDGKQDRKLSGMLSANGTAEFTAAWPDYAATGRYRFELRLPGSDDLLGKTSVAVEAFVPPRIRVDVATDEARASAGEDIAFEVSSGHLFGRPAAGLTAEGRVTFSAHPFTSDEWPDHRFGNPTRAFQTVTKGVGRRSLDADGKTTFTALASDNWKPPAALKMLAAGLVREMSGRAVTGYASRMVDVYPCYVGIALREKHLVVGQPHRADIVCVRPDASVEGEVGQLAVKLERLVWTTVLKADANGNYRYSSEEQSICVRDEHLSLTDGQGQIELAPDREGKYRLTLEEEASGASTAVEFHATGGDPSWYAWSLATPDRVDLSLDRERYRPGQTARLLLKAPFAGTALLTVESTNILHRQVLELTNNTIEIDLPVRAAYAPNVYCAVSLLRPVVAEKTWGPHRATGMVALHVDRPNRRLEVALSAPETMRPRQTMEAEVRVTDEAGNPIAAEVVVAAVDEGICMLTAFETPDPYGYFAAPRLPGFELHDLYARLMPEQEESISGAASLPGGGAGMMAALRKRLNPVKGRRFRPVALWSGSRKTGPDGVARVDFDVPEFTGQLRLMAVALAGAGMGSADEAVTVRRPLIVQSSLPRFAAPDDRFDMPVTIINETGQDGEASITVECEGPLAVAADAGQGGTTRAGVDGATPGAVAASMRIAVANGARVNTTFRLKAKSFPGKGALRIAVSLGKEDFEERTELPVRPPYPRVALTGSGKVGAGQTEALSVGPDWLPETGQAEVWLSSLPTLGMGGGLDYLLRYPYGCLEQTTSQSFPLLHLADLAGLLRPGWLESGAVQKRLESGMQRILSMQRSDGSFSLWPSSGAYVWGTLYATHFLVEANEAGHPVPEERLSAALDFIERWMNGRDEGGDDTYNLSYACCVLALSGRPAHGWTNRLIEKKKTLGRGGRVNVAAALLAAGRRRDALSFMQTIGSPDATVKRETGGSLRSNERDDALLLLTWLGLDPESPAVPLLVRRLESAQRGGRWYTTQDNAMALAALGKYARVLATVPRRFAGTLSWGGADRAKTFDSENAFRTLLQGYRSGGVKLANAGEGAVFYYWKSEGVPRNGDVKEVDKGLCIRRRLMNAGGSPLETKRLRQGDLYIVELTVETDRLIDNVVLQDLLPAGLEVENARLKTSRSIGWIKEKQTLPVLHCDIRDDRLVAFTGPFSGTRRYYYAARAITAGDFIVPPAFAECMYDAALSSLHGAGRIVVASGE